MTNISLQSRDFKILRFLKEQGVCTFSQLQARFFDSYASCIQRLSKLRNFGVIESFRLMDLAPRLDIKTMTIISTLKGVHALRVFRLSDKMFKYFSQSERMAMSQIGAHQILLTYVREKIDPLFIDQVPLTDPEIRARNITDMTPNALVPDIDYGGNIALEVERSDKGRSEYEARFLKYDDSEYGRVLYIVESENQMIRLAEIGRRYEKMGFCHILDLSRVLNYQNKHQSLLSFLKG